MFHAEGKAGFNLGYIEGLADGRAGIQGDTASATGRAHLRLNPGNIEWPERLRLGNYWVGPNGLEYHEGSRNWFNRSKAQVPKAITTNITNKRVYNQPHSFVGSGSGGPNMYGFRRRTYRRRLFRRRMPYRSRRFY